MKKFLFDNNSLKFKNFCKFMEKNSLKFNNIVKNQDVVFFFKITDTFSSIKKNLLNFYISNTRGFICVLELIGLGFSVTAKNNILRFNVGYNHSIFYKVPDDVIVRSKRKTVFVFSNFFFSLRKVIVDLKNFRKLSPYKLKGIKEKNDLYIKKNWKKNIL